MSEPDPKVDLNSLILRPANGHQRLEIIKHVARQWGPPGAGSEQFVQFHDLIETQEYAKDGKMIYWVLVPQHDKDTTDFYSCCRTYRRDVMVFHAGSDAPTTETSYLVSAVVTPPQHRGHSYARRMMSLLHSALASHIYPNSGVDVKIPSSIPPALFSTLYSDVGNYYERCGPLPHEPGWKIISPISTSWTLPETLCQLHQDPSSSLPLDPLSCEDVYKLLSSDVPDLTNLARLPNTTYFAFAPTASIHLYKTTCSMIHPSHTPSPDTHWGARTADGENWITWTFEYDSPARTLQITRLKSNNASFPALLLAALRAGESQGCQAAEAWNLPQELIQAAESVGGTTLERTTHLPALRWYGPQQDDKVVWLMNELYSFA